VKIFNWYITKNVLLNLGLALLILVFVMLSAHFFRAFDMLARGVSPLLLAKMLLYLLPDVLRFALPLSMLIASVLVFSRMSADNEICALKASGVSLWQTISPCLFLSGLLSLGGFYLSLSLAPDCRYLAQQLQWEALTSSPLALLEPGSALQLSERSRLQIGRKVGNLLYEVQFFETDAAGAKLRDVTARSGVIVNNQETRSLELVLKDFTLSEYLLGQPVQTEAVQPFLHSETMIIPLEYGAAQERKPLKRKLKLMNAKMLFADMGMQEAEGGNLSEHWVELHYRFVLAMSPFAFMIMGIPFGIRNRRSESSSGLLVCVLLALFFYGFLLLGRSLKEHAGLHPELILWIPNLLYQIGGLIIIRKIGRH
jgi:lipopolysaccharide export system permease protein